MAWYPIFGSRKRNVGDTYTYLPPDDEPVNEPWYWQVAFFFFGLFLMCLGAGLLVAVGWVVAWGMSLLMGY